MRKKKCLLELVWPRDKDRIKGVQDHIAKKRMLRARRPAPALVAGVDAAFLDDKIISVACLYSFPELEFLEESHVIKKVRFPYIPGLLSFREGPAVMEAVEALTKKPDLLIFDGQGIAHPRGLGIATCAGVLLDIASIGCAKSRLVGEFREPGVKKGSWSPLVYKGKTIGAVVRTQDNTRPLFVSPGHRISLKDSIGFTLLTAQKYRLCEPVRAADMLTKKLKAGYLKNNSG